MQSRSQPLPPRQQSKRRPGPVFRDVTRHRPARSPHSSRRPRPLHGTQAAAQRPRHGPHAVAGRETPPYLAVPRRSIQRSAGRRVMPLIPAGALPAAPLTEACSALSLGILAGERPWWHSGYNASDRWFAVVIDNAQVLSRPPGAARQGTGRFIPSRSSVDAGLVFWLVF